MPVISIMLFSFRTVHLFWQSEIMHGVAKSLRDNVTAYDFACVRDLVLISVASR